MTQNTKLKKLDYTKVRHLLDDKFGCVIEAGTRDKIMNGYIATWITKNFIPKEDDMTKEEVDEIIANAVGNGSMGEALGRVPTQPKEKKTECEHKWLYELKDWKDFTLDELEGEITAIIRHWKNPKSTPTQPIKIERLEPISLGHRIIMNRKDLDNLVSLIIMKQDEIINNLNSKGK